MVAALRIACARRPRPRSTASQWAVVGCRSKGACLLVGGGEGACLLFAAPLPGATTAAYTGPDTVTVYNVLCKKAKPRLRVHARGQITSHRTMGSRSRSRTQPFRAAPSFGASFQSRHTSDESDATPLNTKVLRPFGYLVNPPSAWPGFSEGGSEGGSSPFSPGPPRRGRRPPRFPQSPRATSPSTG